MASTCLFVYGTLRHDQPEHARHCRGVTGWRRARIRGRLWLIPEGYLLLTVPDGAIAMTATANAAADEDARARAQGSQVGNDESWPWIEGEVLEFEDANLAWPPLDGWEGFSPGGESVYARCVVPVEVFEGEGKWTRVCAWAYVATRKPRGSTAVR